MGNSQFFIVAGLSLNAIASVIMLIPYLNSTKNIKEELILNMDMANYTQKKHKKDKKLGIIGFGLFIAGFIFQIIGVLI